MMNPFVNGELLLSISSCSVIAEQLAERLRTTGGCATATMLGGYLAPQAAADYLGVSRKRVHDLTSLGTLTPDGRDGRTPLFTRSTLDAYARGVLTR